MGHADDRRQIAAGDDGSSGQAWYSSTFALDFGTVNPIDCLNYDPRPTFALHLQTHDVAQGPASPLVFCNAALLSSSALHEIIRSAFHQSASHREHEDERTFASWITQQSTSTAPGKSKIFFNTLWTVTVIPDRWAVISGVDVSDGSISGMISVAKDKHVLQTPSNISQDVQSATPRTSVDTKSGNKHMSTHPRAPLGEIWPPHGLGTPAHTAFIRNFDWASTTLGAIDTWSPQLRQACEMMLANPDPTTIFWGPDLILIYNEAYVALAGNKHPQMMGESARIHWAEVWDQYDRLFDQIRLDGKAFKQVNSQLFIQRRGYLEEGFFNMVVIPILDDDGSVVGFYEPVVEVTKLTLTERRMHTLLRLSERTSSATCLMEFWNLLLNALSGDHQDIYFAALYHSQSERLSSNSSPSPNPVYTLKRSVGFEDDIGGFPPTVSVVDTDQDGIAPSIQAAHKSGTSVLLSTTDGSLSPSLLRQFVAAGMTDAPRTCVVCPLSSSVDDSIEAFFVLGVNPKRPYDEDYELFVNLLVKQVESTITFVKLFEKERERLKQQAAYESELKFKKFAENAPVGIFSFDPAGNMTFCNDSWFELSGHDRNDKSAMSWTKDVHPDNIADIQKYWDKVINLEGQQTFEVQYKKPWKPANLSENSISLDRTWVVASAYPETSDDGELTGVTGCITDISSWKWVDQLQSQRLSEALELKRQQENFLDITSHEMRNPLNAILHSALELIDLQTELLTNPTSTQRTSLLNECLDASRTIVYCGRHQKRVIDDVLTLSKLDSNLLNFYPVETMPLEVVEEVLKIFDTELRASRIQTSIELSESYHALGIDNILVDQHRLTQVLINLVANAIKFTKDEPLRSLQVTVSAYTTEPAHSSTGVRYVPSGRPFADPTGQPEWGTGEVVYLHFSVQDTGTGMSREEADLLFNRFAQGSPRTHVQYGGSGLGLFISRELAELHGGQIGILSKPGYGSTFGFYVKGRRPVASKKLKSVDDTVSNTARRRGPAPKHRLPSGLQQPRTPREIHVLIVEDNAINQKILAKLLRKQGYRVSIASHGEEALAVINASTWHTRALPSSETPVKLDIVLADIEMPVMDGKEFVQRIRQLQSGELLSHDIPVIAVTGNARNEQVRLAKDCGFDDVVSKPYSVDDIVSRIKKFTQIDEASEDTAS
jgi:PAS domain S-box-containing protein